MPPSVPRRFVLPVLPSLLGLASFYALALHMYLSLGHWPENIGEQGFSPALVTHAYLNGLYFGALFVGAIVVTPVTVLVCAVVKRWRRAVVPLLISWVSFYACLGGMALGPKGFLTWWWD